MWPTVLKVLAKYLSRQVQNLAKASNPPAKTELNNGFFRRDFYGLCRDTDGGGAEYRGMNG